MVTIAIPFYNAEKYLLDAIKSVFMQTYKKWELILIDDGSTDDSLIIAKSIKDPRVRVYSDGKNKKLAARLNEVTKLARYDYIARMDADDLMMPNRIEELVKILENQKDYDLVSSGVLSVKNDLTLIGCRGAEISNYSLDSLLKGRQGFIHAALVAKKSWYQRNYYDVSLPIAQDRDLWLSASSKDDFRALSISKPLYIYREEGNIKVSKILKAYDLERKMYLKYSKTFPFRLLCVSIFKSLLIILLEAFGSVHLLQKKRNAVINEEIIEEYESFINELQNYKIPVGS